MATKRALDKAQELREKGLSYDAIGKEIGFAGSTVHRWLNPAAREYYKTYKQAHKAKAVQYGAKWRQAHKAEIRAYREAHKVEIAAYRETHKAEKAQWNAAYYKARKAETAQRQAAYYQSHKTEKVQSDVKYRRTHKAQYAACTAKRRALKAGTLIGATIAQLAEIKEIYRRAREDDRVRCYLCGKLIPKGHRHVDHIIALSKGGKHRPSNLAVACDICNLSKHDKLPEDIGLLL